MRKGKRGIWRIGLFGSGMGGGESSAGAGETRPGSHHGLELLEANEAVAVAVDPLDHAAALVNGGALPDPAEDPGDLVRGDDAVSVDVEDGEGEAEVLVGRRRRRVDLQELLQGDEPVPVGVGLDHHPAELLLGGRVAEAGEHRRELLGRDLAVAVGVEFVEDALEVTGNGGGGGRGGGGGGRRRGGVLGFGSAKAEEGSDLSHRHRPRTQPESGAKEKGHHFSFKINRKMNGRAKKLQGNRERSVFLATQLINFKTAIIGRNGL